MTHLLGLSARARLREFASHRSAVVFDFDGTLAPIVADRNLARMRARTHALFTRLCALYPCAVVSGRSLSDTVSHLDGAPVRVVYGSHGLEPGPHLQKYRRMMERIHVELAERVNGYRGIEIEDKRYSLAVHFRAAQYRTDAYRFIKNVAVHLDAPIRLVEGKCVVNIVPRDAPHKGDAVLAIQRHFRAEEVLYVGDDVTDEDAFLYAAKLNWLSFRIGDSIRTAASYYLRRQREIDVLLARLIRLRQARRQTRVVFVSAS